MSTPLDSTETRSIIGAVEEPRLVTASPKTLKESPTYQAMEKRLHESARIAILNDQRSLCHLEQELTAILTDLAQNHRLDGLMVASSDGLAIAKSEKLEQDTVFAAIAALCDGICTRVRREPSLELVDEITLRSRNGARLMIRSFAGMEGKFLLVASATHSIPRWVIDEAIDECGTLLHSFLSPLSLQEFSTQVHAPPSIWRRAVRRLLAPLRTSILLD